MSEVVRDKSAIVKVSWQHMGKKLKVGDKIDLSEDELKYVSERGLVEPQPEPPNSDAVGVSASRGGR